MKKPIVFALAAAMLAAGCSKNNEPAPDDYAQQITDAAFKAYCLDEFDTDGDGRLSLAEVMAATEINLFSADITTVASLKGIEHFKNLTSLNCSINQLTELSLTNLPALTNLNCSINQLTELSLTNLPALTYLHCNENQLTELNVSGLTALTNLCCEINRLTELDVSGLTKLVHLRCFNNQFSELDVSGNGVIRFVYCGKENGTAPLTVFVDPQRTLGDGAHELEINVTIVRENGAINYKLITEKNTPVNGVTVTNKP